MDELENIRCCGTCQHFYDVWQDGTGKCSKAHGGITQSDHGTTCAVWRYDKRYFCQESDD